MGSSTPQEWAQQNDKEPAYRTGRYYQQPQQMLTKTPLLTAPKNNEALQ